MSMKEIKTNTNAIDKYIAAYPADAQLLLKQLRTCIRKAAPDAEEVMSYQMPAYKYHGMLTWFAGHKNHIGFYPGASGIETFKKELSVYKEAKGSVQFPLDKPLPLELVEKIIKFKVKENIEKAQAKKKK